MVTKLAQSTETTEAQWDNADIEKFISEVGLTFWAEPYAFIRENESARNTGLDEEFLYSMGYTLSELPVNYWVRYR